MFNRYYAHFAPKGGYSAEAVANSALLHRRPLLARWLDFGNVKFQHSWVGAMGFTTNDGAIFREIEPGLFAILTNDVAPMTRGA